MAFVRVKKINGNRYGYLVENTWQQKGSRQQVKAYLGKVLTPEAKTNTTLPDISEADYKNSVLSLVSWTLGNHGFVVEGQSHSQDRTNVCLEKNHVSHKNKNAVLELNQGFLCNHTLQQLLDFCGEGTRADEVGKRLANTLLEAGVEVPEDLFVDLFNKVYKPIDDSGGF